MVCPRLKYASVATDIPTDEVHDEQLRRITKAMKVGHDAGFTLSGVGVDASVAPPVSDQARVYYTKAWDSSVGDVVFSVRF